MLIVPDRRASISEIERDKELLRLKRQRLKHIESCNKARRKRKKNG